MSEDPIRPRSRPSSSGSPSTSSWLDRMDPSSEAATTSFRPRRRADTLSTLRGMAGDWGWRGGGWWVVGWGGVGGGGGHRPQVEQGRGKHALLWQSWVLNRADLSSTWRWRQPRVPARGQPPALPALRASPRTPLAGLQVSPPGTSNLEVLAWLHGRFQPPAELVRMSPRWPAARQSRWPLAVAGRGLERLATA